MCTNNFDKYVDDEFFKSQNEVFDEMSDQEFMSFVVGEEIIPTITDEMGCVYSCDGKYCFGYNKAHWSKKIAIKSYAIKDGVEIICKKAFAGCSEMEDILIPESVTEIEDEAFYGCRCLKSILLTQITSVGKLAFYDCYSLEDIIFYFDIKSIGVNALNRCDKVKSISFLWPYSKDLKPYGRFMSVISTPNKKGGLFTSSDYDLFLCDKKQKVLFCYINNNLEIKIPNGIEDIRTSAFCEKYIRKIEIPTSVRYIGENVFRSCTNLIELILPDNIASLNVNIMENCFSLKKLVLPKNLETIEDYPINSFAKYSLDLSYLNKLELPEGLKHIGARSFVGLEIFELIIPSSLETFGEGAFRNCRSLNKVISLSPKYIANNTDGTLTYNGKVILQWTPKSEEKILEKNELFN